MTSVQKKQEKQEKRNQQPRHLDPGSLLLAVYTLTMAVLVVLGWFGSAAADPAGQTESDRTGREELVTLDAVQQGELLLPSDEPGKFRAAPMLSMDVDIRVSGIAARATVRQHFSNDSDEWVEALYVFPLPDESAVDHLEMRINDRVVVGKIQKKEEARKTYEAAKKAGKKTSLLSQQRPNIFTTAVANIGPGETVIIQIEYQQVVQRQDSLYSLRFPMLVGPRYSPGFSGGAGETAAHTLPQLSVVKPNEAAVNPVNLHVNLAAGMELARIDSLYHGITSSKNEDRSIDIRFTSEVKADRDFVLEWEPEKQQAPAVTLFSEQKGDERYMLLMVMPPEQAQQEPLAREVVFILDTSGSMGGESIRQAKKALRMAVERMRPRDRFNVIEFNSTARSLFNDSRPGSPENISRAVAFIEGLEANGGTEISTALDMALDGQQKHERIRQIVFLTDGSVSNEAELFTMIHDRLGDSRLFTVGIGSAPNSYFMTRAAAMGRGSYTFIGKLEEVRGKMTGLFFMLEQPAITNLQLTGAEGLKTLPSPLPDLYQGEPLTVVVKGKGEAGQLQLAGLRGGVTPWQMTVDTTAFTDRPGIAVLWARKKIRILLDSLSSGADPQQVRQEVTELALNNHLVSRYTSLVAVEEKVSRPKDASLQKQAVKSNLPAGWQYSSVFAGGSATATPAALQLLIGTLFLLLTGLLIWLHRRMP
ncbi:MAG: marine proteobacterial sortase target protein [Candidatus Electrothrix sp. YB6]